jgi:hypothetical protein
MPRLSDRHHVPLFRGIYFAADVFNDEVVDCPVVLVVCLQCLA